MGFISGEIRSKVFVGKKLKYSTIFKLHQPRITFSCKLTNWMSYVISIPVISYTSNEIERAFLGLGI